MGNATSAEENYSQLTSSECERFTKSFFEQYIEGWTIWECDPYCIRANHFENGVAKMKILGGKIIQLPYNDLRHLSILRNIKADDLATSANLYLYLMSMLDALAQSIPRQVNVVQVQCTDVCGTCWKAIRDIEKNEPLVMCKRISDMLLTNTLFNKLTRHNICGFYHFLNEFTVLPEANQRRVRQMCNAIKQSWCALTGRKTKEIPDCDDYDTIVRKESIAPLPLSMLPEWNTIVANWKL